MKPFNLEKALAGAKLVTRDGREVLDFRRNPKAEKDNRPDSDQWLNYEFSLGDGWKTCSEEGRFYGKLREADLDLFLADSETVELKAGMWVKCVQDCVMELGPNRGKKAVEEGKWYQLKVYDSPAYFVVESAVMTSHPFDNETGDGVYFDLENPKTEKPAETVELKNGMWVQCIKEYRPNFAREMFVQPDWYRITNEPFYNIGLHLPLYGQVTFSVESAKTKFNLQNPRDNDPTEIYRKTASALGLGAPYGQNVLQEAAALIYGDRQADYGSVTDNFRNIAEGWKVIFGCNVTPEQVGLAMAWLKIARQVHKPKRDNLVDAAGYIGCIDKMEQEKKEIT